VNSCCYALPPRCMPNVTEDHFTFFGPLWCRAPPLPPFRWTRNVITIQDESHSGVAPHHQLVFSKAPHPIPVPRKGRLSSLPFFGGTSYLPVKSSYHRALGVLSFSPRPCLTKNWEHEFRHCLVTIPPQGPRHPLFRRPSSDKSQITSVPWLGSRLITIPHLLLFSRLPLPPITLRFPGPQVPSIVIKFLFLLLRAYYTFFPLLERLIRSSFVSLDDSDPISFGSALPIPNPLVIMALSPTHVLGGTSRFFRWSLDPMVQSLGICLMLPFPPIGMP